MKVNQAEEWVDILRFYLHHSLLWYVPLMMVLLKLHTLDYRRVWSVPMIFLIVMLFIMLNQVFQSELGFIGLRGDDIHQITYINNSLIWGPDGNLSKLIEWAVPDFFKTIPVGEHAGETKYWPWFWLIVPCFVILIPLCFVVSLIFDFPNFKEDFTNLINKIKSFSNERGAC